MIIQIAMFGRVFRMFLFWTKKRNDNFSEMDLEVFIKMYLYSFSRNIVLNDASSRF